MSTRGNDRPSSNGQKLHEAGTRNGESIIDREHFELLSRLHIDVQQLALPLQCHSSTVQMVEAPGTYASCDSLVTKRRDVAVAVRVADCPPLLFFDPANMAVAAIHAGWRGTSEKIAAKTLCVMMAEFNTNPNDILAYIGPAASACCYEIGNDVAGFFENSVISRRAGKMFLDLKKENTAQLLRCGVQRRNIEVSDYCTICERALFYSYRRDGRGTGRMLAAICVKS